MCLKESKKEYGVNWIRFVPDSVEELISQARV